MTGRIIGGDIDELWDAWTPADIARRLSGIHAPWYVAAGWSLELFTDNAARPHGDLEIGVPASQFDEVTSALPGFDWDVAGSGLVWPYPEHADREHQTWLREPTSGMYRVDVFREPHLDNRWICRRDTSITLPHDELIMHNDDGIPHCIPEVALLFKARSPRRKDEFDFRRVLPALDRARRSRLIEWLCIVHPGHPWIEKLRSD